MPAAMTAPGRGQKRSADWPAESSAAPVCIIPTVDCKESFCVIAIVCILHVRPLALNRVNGGGAAGAGRTDRRSGEGGTSQPHEQQQRCTSDAAAFPRPLALHLISLPKVDARIEIDDFIWRRSTAAAAADSAANDQSASHPLHPHPRCHAHRTGMIPHDPA